MFKNNKNFINGPMLNAYPDSIGKDLGDMVEFLRLSEIKDVFDAFYILPSVFNSDLDRGFSIIDYEINRSLASVESIENIKELGLSFKFDFVLNHLSVLSRQFQDILRSGSQSEYKDFFINWNEFWKDKGALDDDGVIKPDEAYIKDMFFRKPSLPILKVRYPDGSEVPFWNTFYQEIKYIRVDAVELVEDLNMQYGCAVKLAKEINEHIKDNSIQGLDLSQYENQNEIRNYIESRRTYLGQMDLNIKSQKVWDFYCDTLKKLSSYGAKVIRLDAFAYASKEVGMRNFFNEPHTWDLLGKLNDEAQQYNIQLLPEIHSSYAEKIHEKIAEKGYFVYDFFLPGLIIDAFERHTNEALIRWINDIQQKGLKTVNMLGCHDGIPLLDLKGLLTDEQIQNLIDIVVDRGGHVKELHGKKNMYYQVNATYYSALGEEDQKMLFARAIQMFMPGIPQVWYLDLFAGKNDYEALKRAGTGGHKEINRTNISLETATNALDSDIVKSQIELLRFRKNCKAFDEGAQLTIEDSNQDEIKLSWMNGDSSATLAGNLRDYSFEIITD